ncbi:hypothetical protein B1759_10970 [Rubrivirga sp. SAORIC476]|nr:hypothetical protein B1759_10970 [Rubrivirga sp. SAORIC476]
MMRHLLWIDSAAGALVGTVVLLASEELSGWYGLPRGLLLVTGAANVLYAAYSGSLAVRAVRPRAGIVALVVANAAWAVVCLALVWAYAGRGGGLGLLHLGAEAAVVGGLAALEWRHRDALRVA